MDQRLLVLGKRGGILHWYEHLISAATAMHQVEVDGFALNHNGFFERTAKNISSVTGKSSPAKITASSLKKKIHKFQPNIILIADLFYLSDPVLAVLIDIKAQCRIVHWIGDFFDERLINSNQVIDRYYFSDTGLVASAIAMGLTNSEYLPLAFNPKLFYGSRGNRSKSNDLLFIGAWSQNREELIKNIELPMHVIGKGWAKMTGTAHTILSKNIPISEVAKLYQQHNFVLNDINANNISCGLNMRCFEAPACGSLLITNEVLDLKLCYEPNREVVCYQNSQQLIQKYIELLNDQNQRNAIQRAGMQKVYECHTYAHRLDVIFSGESNQSSGTLAQIDVIKRVACD